MEGMKLKKVILPAMGVFSNTGGFSIKRYQSDNSIGKLLSVF